MRFELKGTRPSKWTMIFLLALSLCISISAYHLSEPLNYLSYLGGLLFGFAFLHQVYHFVRGKSVKALETGKESLFLEYHNGRKAEFKYQDIVTLIFLPSASRFGRKTLMLSFFFRVRAGPYETSKYIAFKVPDEKTVKAIIKEMESHAVPLDPSASRISA